MRQLLDQLEAPPTLSGLREAFGLDEPADGSAPKQGRHHDNLDPLLSIYTGKHYCLSQTIAGVN